MELELDETAYLVNKSIKNGSSNLEKPPQKIRKS